MSAQTDKRHPYRRPIRGWWKRDRYYIRYLAMEATSILIALYALILLFGLLRLGQGEAAFNGWLEALRSSPSVALHVLLLLVFIYHSYSWFKVMPKTLPAIYWRGAKLPQPVITRIGVCAAVIVNLLVIILFTGLQP
ncbi:MAG TPA: fumarate reductase subunit C [Gammaproteobacteria bacterium]|nr:fumarate reductase subunit C [Gammaproteobacteria bacterium]